MAVFLTDNCEWCLLLVIVFEIIVKAHLNKTEGNI